MLLKKLLVAAVATTLTMAAYVPLFPYTASAALGPTINRDVAVREKSERAEPLVAQAGGAVGTSPTGEATYEYSFDLPTSRGNFMPKLALTYRSGARATSYGVGWQLSEAYIERVWDAALTEQQGHVGLPERYSLRLNEAMEELVALGNGRFRPALSDIDLTITKGPDGFSATDGNGNIFAFQGFDSVGARCASFDTCTRWFLSSVTDANSNVSEWHYATFGTQALLTELDYNAMDAPNGLFATRVVLNYEPQDEAQPTRAGFGLAWNSQRLQRVQIRHRAAENLPETVLRAYELHYVDSPETGRSLLREVVLTGQRGEVGPRPTRFEYQARLDAGSRPYIAFDDATLLTEGPPGWCPSFCDPPVEWLDLDGDDRPDLVQGEWWARNLTEIGAATLVFGPMQRYGCFNSVPPSLSWDIKVQSTKCVDVNGDKLPDMVATYGGCTNGLPAGDGGFRIRLARFEEGAIELGPPMSATSAALLTTYCRAMPHGGFSVVAQAKRPAPFSRVSLDDVASFEDINGDRVPDYLIAEGQPGSATWSVFPGYISEAGTYAVAPPYTIPSVLPSLRHRKPVANVYDTGDTIQDLADINGDGIKDRLETIQWSAQNTIWDVSLGIDGARFGGPVRYAIVDKWVGPASVIGPRGTTEAVGGSLIDLNGDGALDYVKKASPVDPECAGAASFACPWVVSWNTGEHLGGTGAYGMAGSKSLIAMPTGYDLTLSHLASVPADLYPWGMRIPLNSSSPAVGGHLIDANGDGILDYVAENWLFGSLPIQFFRGRGSRGHGGADLLTAITTPLLARTELTYMPSSKSTSDVGPNGNGRTGGIVPILSRSVTTGPALQPVAMKYWYEGPNLSPSPFDHTRVDFRGFADTWAVNESTGQVAHTRWHASYGMLGRAVSKERGEVASEITPGEIRGPPRFSVLQREKTIWGMQRWDSGECGDVNGDDDGLRTKLPARLFTREQRSQLLVRQRTFTSARVSLCAKLVRGALGVTHVKASTVVTDPDTGVGQDEGSEALTFDVNARCTACPVLRVHRDTSQTVVSATRYLYDAPIGTVGPVIPFGNAGSGRLAYTEELAAGGTAPRWEVSSRTAYNADGTVSFQESDDPPTRVTYIYDALRLNPKRQVASDASGHALAIDVQVDATGQAASVIGPYVPGQNAKKAEAHYLRDAFGRLTRKATAPFTDGKSPGTVFIREYLDQSVPYAERDITLASSAPVGANVDAGVLPVASDVTRYFDGIRRPIQERHRLGSGSPSEDPDIGVVQRFGKDMVRVEGVNLYDAGGRVVVSLDPFYSMSTDYHDYWAGKVVPSDATGVAAVPGHAVRHDAIDRVVCDSYGPGPSTGASEPCVSTFASGAAYRSSTRTEYTSRELDGVRYVAVQTFAPAQNTGGSDVATAVLHDASGRVHARADTYGNMVAETYDSRGLVTSVSRILSTQKREVERHLLEYDAKGRLIAETNREFGRREYGYNASDNVVAMVWTGIGMTERRRTELKYKNLGRQTSVREVHERRVGSQWKVLSDSKTNAYYDAAPSAMRAWIGPDDYRAGRLVALQRDKQSLAFSYDRLGNAIERAQWFDGHTSPPYRISRSYRADGRVRRVELYRPGKSAPSGSYEIGYDSAARPARAWDGGTVIWESAQSPTGGYDASNRLTGYKEDNGSIVGLSEFASESSLRSRHSIYRRGTVAATASVPVVEEKNIAYVGSDVTSVEGSTPQSHTEAYYDANQRLTVWKRGVGAAAYRQRTSFFLDKALTGTQTSGDSLGQLERLEKCQVPGCVDLTYEYGDPSRPQRLSRIRETGRTNGVASLSYTPFGEVKQLTRHPRLKVDGILGPKTTAALQYWVMAEPSTILDSVSISKLQVAIGDKVDGTLGRRTVRRLQKFVRSHGLAAPRSGVLDRRTVSSLQRYLNRGATDRFAYDAEGRLVQARRRNGTTVRVSYDPSGAMSQENARNSAGAVVSRQVGQDATAVVFGAGIPAVQLHVLVAKTRVATLHGGGITYEHRDRQGNVVATTEARGLPGRSYEYDPYGVRIGSAVSPFVHGTNLGYAGSQMIDEELVLLGRRVYDVHLRQFLQPDLLTVDAYSYAAGDPLNRDDPFGMQAEEIGSEPLQTPESAEATTSDYVYGGTLSATIEWEAPSSEPTFTPAEEGVEVGDYVFVEDSWQPVADRISFEPEEPITAGASTAPMGAWAGDIAGKIAENSAQIDAGTATGDATPDVHGVDVFVFGALTVGPPGPVRPELEAIALGGYNTSSGFFAGDIFAAGMAVGGHDNYGAYFTGVETTTDHPSPVGIKIIEGSIGVELPFLGGGGVGAGVYKTSIGERGFFFFVQGGVIGQYGSVGVGVGW